MTRPWRPVAPHATPRPSALRVSRGRRPGDLDRRAPEDFIGEGDPAPDLVWLGDATRGLDEFVAATKPPRDPATSRDAAAGVEPASAPVVSSPFRGTPPPPPWRMRRVVLPAVMVLAGVALVSNLETQAPAPVLSLPQPPAVPSIATPTLEFRTALLESPLAPWPDSVAASPPDRSPAEFGVSTAEAPASSARPLPPVAPGAAPASSGAPRPPMTPPQSQTSASAAPVTVAAAAPPSVAAIAEGTSRTRETPASVPERSAAAVDVPAAAPPAAETTTAVATDAVRPPDDRTDPRPATSAAAAPRRESETRAIEQVLGEYRAAFNRRDAGAAAAVWPTVNEKALARAFDRLDEQAVEFDECRLEIGDDRAQAACRGTARYVPSVGSRTPKVDARQWRFNLGRTAGRWTIVSVEAR